MYFDDCPNWKIADEHLRSLAGEFPDLVVTKLKVTTPEDAERYDFRGSPSILINGVDPFAAPDDPVGLSCRIYQTSAGQAGSPTIEQLREVFSRSW